MTAIDPTRAARVRTVAQQFLDASEQVEYHGGSMNARADVADAEARFKDECDPAFILSLLDALDAASRGAGEDTRDAVTCWRCRKAAGVVTDGRVHECFECAGQSLVHARETLNAIDEAVREGLTCWPRIADRVEFVRECVQLHRQAAPTSH